MNRILLAEDETRIASFVAKGLQAHGFTVTVVEDGEQALEALEQGPFDLIITDMVMPNVDGIELIKTLRRTQPDVPVIGISAGLGGSDADLMLRAAKAVGATTVLAKPLTRKELLAAVLAALQRG